MIYLHIPFCRSFCTYCDFYSEVAPRCLDATAYLSALTAEIKERSAEINDKVNTLYIGGGTPSVLPLVFFRDVLRVLDECGKGGPFKEFTIEVNPDDIVEKGEAYVEGLLELGVNRVSMGIQSFDDSILKWMNRRHDSATARKAYSILENVGVKNISIDLIFGLPQVDDQKWADTLKAALEISPSGALPRHISSYQLSVEPGSALARMEREGKWSEAADDQCENQYGMLCAALKEAGYHHYEISNFALPGYEAVHNSAYWNHSPYVGLGPGAHSFSIEDGNYIRKWNEPDLKAYIKDLKSVRGSEILDWEQIAMEKIMLGLRTSAGVEEEYLIQNGEAGAVGEAIKNGLLVRLPDGHLRIPEDRFFISDSIISEIV